MELYKKILKNEVIADSILNKNDEKSFISTGIISLNLLFSGRVEGGIPYKKISMIAAPSTLGKSLIGYSILKNFQKRIDDSFCIVIDTEKSFDYSIAEKFKINSDETKLMVIQNNNIEDVEHAIVSISRELPKDEQSKLFFMIDSWGGLVTSKTMKDANDAKDVKDMTETLKKNRLAKIILNINSTFFVVNHVYDNIGGYGDPLSIPGGRKIYYNSSSVVLGKSKAKDKEKDSDGDELRGAIVSCRCHKSRDSKEKSELKFRINYDNGLDMFYGLLDDAIDGKYVFKPKNGVYSRTHIKDDKEFKAREIYNSDFWLPIFKDTDFKKYLESKYSFIDNSFIDNSEIIL